MLSTLAFAFVAQSLSSPISLTVDARDVTRGLYHVSEQFAAKPGKLVLWYPLWQPGGHMPTGSINSITDFRIAADGKTLAWSRDLVEMNTFTTTVPAGARTVTVDFTHADSSGSAHIGRIHWLSLLWYPTMPTDDVFFQANLILPADWKAASALPLKSESGNRVEYLPASLTRLADSPCEIGRYYRQYDVTGSSSVKHYLDLMTDTSEGVEAPPAIVDSVRRIHEEMEAITGAHHYRDYHWLLTLSDNGGFDGLEHHESSEDGMGSAGFTSDKMDLADLLCHEYFHSYNGKFRRPIGLCTPDFQKPMKDDLLWVYEGLTQFMGHILSCRAGWWTQEQWREQMALNYVEMNTHRGREWRPLEDTAAGIPSQARGGGFSRGPSWASAHRTQDYYVEMTLVWLEVDMRIRQLTNGEKSLMDFLRVFHGGASNGPELKPYNFDDVAAALNKVTPYDWAGLLRERVYTLQPELTQQGFELAGWHLVYNDTPNLMMGQIYGSKDALFLPTSVGMMISEDGTISDLVPGSPADRARLSPGMKILSVNGVKFGNEAMSTAVKKGGTIDLIVSYKEEVRPVGLVYGGGLKIPHLEQVPGTPDRLTDLLKPLSH